MSVPNYLHQKIARGIRHSIEIDRVLAQGHTAIQRYRILEFKSLGRCIELNGCIQSTEFDESYYHESLIFPAFAFNRNIKRVLCFGGANGGIINRLTLIPSIQEVVQVDIDPQLYYLSQQYLPFLHSRDTPSFNYSLHFNESPYDWLQKLDKDLCDKFDLVIADLPDSTSDSYVPRLFTKSFYSMIKSILSDEGAFVTQAGQMNTLELDFHIRARATLLDCFGYVTSYASFVPSYGTPWGFLYASDNINAEKVRLEEIDNNLSQINPDNLKYYDRISHSHCFNLPKIIRQTLSSVNEQVIEDSRLATVQITDTEGGV